MNYNKLNAFNAYCDKIEQYNKTKPSQIIILWKSWGFKLFWIGCVIGKILVKLGVKVKWQQ